jgi:hypothetical protein
MMVDLRIKETGGKKRRLIFNGNQNRNLTRLMTRRKIRSLNRDLKPHKPRIGQTPIHLCLVSSHKVLIEAFVATGVVVELLAEVIAVGEAPPREEVANPKLKLREISKSMRKRRKTKTIEEGETTRMISRNLMKHPERRQ